jgi:hypothetical protein
MEVNLKTRPWYNYLEEDLHELLEESFELIEKVPEWHDGFHDYSFVVFPAAKAFEGFLKKMFIDLGFITKEEYYGKRFRVGKALNPQLEEKYRAEGVYDKIVQYCGGKDLADKLWETWKNCRNLVFHWFPDEKRAINYDEAKQRVDEIVSAIDQSFRECKINMNGQV